MLNSVIPLIDIFILPETKVNDPTMVPALLVLIPLPVVSSFRHLDTPRTSVCIVEGIAALFIICTPATNLQSFSFSRLE